MSPFDLIVVGGGPAGSVAATLAAKADLSVLIIEADTHPRYHVGESLLPGILPILKEMDCFAEVEQAGFDIKTGSTHHGFGRRSWDLWFHESDEFDTAYFVERARFDAILFDAAKRAGATCLQNTRVKCALEEGGRVVGVELSSGENYFSRWVFDASGQAAVIAGPRSEKHTIDGLKHRARFAFWKSDGRLDKPRERQAFFQGLDDAWLWCFPLGPNRRSVGLVELEGTPVGDYDQLVKESSVGALLGADATRSSKIWRAKDWSYERSPRSGDGWLALGDTAGFIDPILSSGVMLAMHSGWLAARLLAQQITGGISPAQVHEEYEAKHGEMFDDLLGVVRFYYAQNGDIDRLFWKSKELLSDLPAVSPQKAFLLLTSGLVRNLALGKVTSDTAQKRLQKVLAETAKEERPSAFICAQLSFTEGERTSTLYLLIEPSDLAAPSLFRTASFDINCLAPDFNNDPILHPPLEAPLRKIAQLITDLDQGTEPLGLWWQHAREPLLITLSELPDAFEVVRIFGA